MIEIKTVGHKILELLYNLENENKLYAEPLNKLQGHYRVYIGTKKIDVWITTCKFTVVGSGTYSKDFLEFKNLIFSSIDKS